MFDHLDDDFKSEVIEGEVFEILWTKDKCKIRNHMYAQVGPIAIIYQKPGKKLLTIYVPLRSKKAGRFEIILDFARSHSIVPHGSVSFSCASTPHLSCFSES